MIPSLLGLWCLMIAILVVALVERNRLHQRIDRLEHKLSSPVHPRPESEAVRQVTPVAPTSQPRPVTRPVTPPPRRSEPVVAIPPRGNGFRLPKVNVPAVFGVLISLIGFALLLKLAMDQGWLRLSVETRHLLVATTGMSFIIGGWRWRRTRETFSRSLLGGGIATLCLTIYSAVMVFEILSEVLGFGLLVSTVIAAGLLASGLRSRTLAILGLVGGLSAPMLFLMKNDPALSHVLGYYTIFAAATLGLSLRHRWPIFHLLSFLGTFGSSALWILSHLFSSETTGWPVQACIGTLFLLYFGVLLFSPRARIALAERALVFATPTATMTLFAFTDLGREALAMRSVLMALLYAAAATWLYRSGRKESPLTPAFAAIACGLGALAVPLGLDGEWITAAWATGAAVQIWVATRQGLRRHTFAAVGLLALAAIHHLLFLVDWRALPEMRSFFHGAFLTGVWLSAAGLLSGWWIDRGNRERPSPPLAAWVAFGIGVGTWLLTTLTEIARVVSEPRQVAACTGLLAFTALVGEATGWRAFRKLNLAYPFSLMAMASWTLFAQPYPTANSGWLAWPVALGVLGMVIARQRGAARDAGLWVLHLLGLGLAAWEVHDRLGRVLEGDWPLALVTMMLASWAIFANRFFGDRDVYRKLILPTAAVALVLLLVVLQLGSGDPAPFPFVPLLNPLDVATVLVIVALAMRLHRDRQANAWTIGPWALACGSMTVLRTVHHVTGVPFTGLSLWSSMTAQTALTVAWAVTGMVGMACGTLRARRTAWSAGAWLMGIVVAKLFLVDLAGVNTGARIVSFLGVGALLLAAGYLAPAPPKEVTQ